MIVNDFGKLLKKINSKFSHNMEDLLDINYFRLNNSYVGNKTQNVEIFHSNLDGILNVMIKVVFIYSELKQSYTI